jgi:hypothetical protein
VQVDPVVGEGLGLTRHQRDQAQVAIAQPTGGRSHLDGGRRVETLDQLRQRDARQDGLDGMLGLPAIRAHHDRLSSASRVPDRDAAVVEQHRDVAFLDPVPECLPHLSGAEPGIQELLDQGGGMAAPQSEDAERGLREAELLDPLRRPLRLDLGAGNAPHLLRVRTEESVVETASEPMHHPLLERPRLHPA